MTEESLLPSPPQEPLLPTKEETAATLEREVQEYKDKYLRALAEIENSRKRLSKEKIESQAYAVQNVVGDLLQPIDHFEQALQHAERANAEIAHWAKGFEMILAQLRQVLEDHGVSSYDSIGQVFDPHLHEAVETEEHADVSEGTIVFEFQKGYRLGGRTLRAARVRVAVPPKAEETVPPKS